MKKKVEKGFSKERLGAMTPSQRRIMQRDIERDRLEVVRELESLLGEISKKKKGKALHMRNTKILGRRPNDTLEN